MIGTMCGVDEAIEWLMTKSAKKEDMPERIANRLKYMKAKEDGIRPRYCKGIYGKKYDTWVCGHCGALTRDGVGDDFCCKCGYRIKWDSPRCLTGRKETTT